LIGEADGAGQARSPGDEEQRPEIYARPGEIVIRVARPREGWDAAFRAMAAAGDDAPPDPDAAGEWDEEEWEWWSRDSTCSW
jgi:hypothetical protein